MDIFIKDCKSKIFMNTTQTICESQYRVLCRNKMGERKNGDIADRYRVGIVVKTYKSADYNR